MPSQLRRIFAVSFLADGGGNDTYTVTNCVSNGSAHDFSVERVPGGGRNDLYDLRGSALGQGLKQRLGAVCGTAG